MKTLIKIAIGIFIVIYGIGYLINYQYETKIGGYVNNAVDMNVPEKMLEQLNMAKQGMTNEGLTPELYGAMFFKKPDNSMEFQYKHIDSIIERVQAVMEWREKTYANGTQIESLGDVYEQKMTNLRNFIKEDVRSDWIAHKAWVIKNYPWYYVISFGGPIQSSGKGSNVTIMAFMAAIGTYFFLTKKKNKTLIER